MASWQAEVAYLPTGEAVRPGDVLVEPADADDASTLIGWDAAGDEAVGPDRLVRLSNDPGGAEPGEHVADAIAQLHLAGIWAQPNHVLFSTCWSRSMLGAAPLHASAADVYAAPLHASGLLGEGCCSCCPPHPTRGEPGAWKVESGVVASPLHASPLHASGYIATGDRPSTVLPASKPADWVTADDHGEVEVVIIDTGLPELHLRPEGFGTDLSAERTDEPDVDPPGPDDPDGVLDPVAGHGMFISGIVTQVAPTARLRHIGLVGPCGNLDEHRLAIEIRRLAARDIAPNVLSLSLAGYASEGMWDLARAVRAVQRRNTVVVASAGNDATCRPTYPAALAGVIGVGAVDRNKRPAPFTNYGPWVRACAFGIDVVSYFFKDWSGEWRPNGLPAGVADTREGWAVWSGTSFAAPRVAGLIAQEMISQVGVKNPTAAVAAVLARSTATVPWLGSFVE